ncbi:MAG: hypothetical protein OEW83_07675 [Acidimicrobiia bacterium]|nr:hypothetical protein [Acidimicrobiia bacterium]
MQLNNVVKKVGKAADKLGIQPGEEVLAACTTNPRGTMNRILAKELGGVIGALAAGRGDRDTPADGGMAARFPEGQHYLVVTNRRLLACSVSTMSGKPKELVAEWPVDDVLAIATEAGKLSLPMTIAFTDGTAVGVEAANGTGGNTLAPAIESLRANTA